MVEKLIISLDRDTGKAQGYPSMVMAADDVGVTKQAIAFAVKNGGSCAGRQWKKAARMFVVKAKGRLYVCQKSGNAYLDLGGDHVFRGKDIEKVVDVTVAMWEATL